MKRPTLCQPTTMPAGSLVARPGAAVDGLRRRGLAAGALSLLLPLGPGALAAGPAGLPVAVDLGEALVRALHRGEPLVVMVSLQGCPFCVVASNNYLAPLRAEGRIAVVQVDMRTARMLRDFEGLPVTHDAMARRWAVKVAPTVLFFGRGGSEVAERLVGGYLPDFYGAYLDDRLQQARQAVRA